MNTDVSGNIHNERINLLKKLKKLLEEQIRIIHQGNANDERIDDFNRQAELIVKEIIESGLLENKEFDREKEQIKKLYNTLNLAVMAQRDETSKNIKEIRRGKKTIEVYRGNL